MQEDQGESPQLSPETTPAQEGGEQGGSELIDARKELKGVREEKESLQSELSIARDELEKVRDPRSRDHRSPPRLAQHPQMQSARPSTDRHRKTICRSISSPA